MSRESLDKIEQFLDVVQDYPETGAGYSTKMSVCGQLGRVFDNIGWLVRSGTIPSLITGQLNPTPPDDEFWNKFETSICQLKEFIKMLAFVVEKRGYIFFMQPRLAGFLPKNSDELFSVTRANVGKPPGISNDLDLHISIKQPDTTEDDADKKTPGTNSVVAKPLRPFTTSVFAGDVLEWFDGVPFDRLKKCPNCDKVFIQKSGKEKKFCSELCRVRHHQKMKDK